MESRLKSRKFWLAIISALVAAIAAFGYNVDATTVGIVLLPILAAIFGFAWEDGKKAEAKGYADTELRFKSPPTPPGFPGPPPLV